MKKFFKPKEIFSTGLDIGTQSIKIAKLKFNKDSTIELCDFGIEENYTNLEEVLRNILRAHSVTGINISFSGPSTVLRYVTFPKMNASELKQALKFEAQKHIPFSIEEVNLDGCILKDDLANNKMLILIAAVKKDLVNQRIQLLTEMGAKVNFIDIDSLALVNSFNLSYSQEDVVKQKTIALLNIGAVMANLSILENGQPRLSRDIQIGGNNFTQRISDNLGIDFKAAEEKKIKPAGQDLKEIIKILDTTFVQFAGGIRTSFDYYESQSASSVTKIFLSGGGSKLEGLKEALAAHLGIEVQHWDPLKQVALSSEIDTQALAVSSAHLATAVGLALRKYK